MQCSVWYQIHFEDQVDIKKRYCFLGVINMKLETRDIYIYIFQFIFCYISTCIEVFIYKFVENKYISKSQFLL